MSEFESPVAQDFFEEILSSFNSLFNKDREAIILKLAEEFDVELEKKKGGILILYGPTAQLVDQFGRTCWSGRQAIRFDNLSAASSFLKENFSESSRELCTIVRIIK